MFQSRDESLCIICDVGSATVVAGLVLFTKKTKPKIITTVQIPISFSETLDVSVLETRMMGYLKQALTNIYSEGLSFAHTRGIKNKKIDKVFVMLASPWYAAKASRVRIEKDRQFELNSESISEAVKDEETLFESEAIKGMYPQVKGKDVRMIERETVKVLLNGYETLFPFNKRASLAELSFYMSLVPEHIVKAIERMATDCTHANKVIFHTFPLAFFGAIRTAFPHEKDYVLVDVAGESTDISLIRKGTIEASTSFQSGRNELLRMCMNDLSITEDIAESYLRMNMNQTLEPELEAQFKSALEKNSEKWTSQFTDTLRAITTHSHIPHTCFVVADESISDQYLECIRSCGTALGISKVLVIKPELLASFIDQEKHTKANVCVSLEALYIHMYKVHAEK